jgi:uncharacterized repeat protein (TIGR01451 family)
MRTDSPHPEGASRLVGSCLLTLFANERCVHGARMKWNKNLTPCPQPPNSVTQMVTGIESDMLTESRFDADLGPWTSIEESPIPATLNSAWFERKSADRHRFGGQFGETRLPGSGRFCYLSREAPSVALCGRQSGERMVPAREGIPMQSSLWKVLTAAGIIGIGTMIVLEVQRRLPVPSANGSLPATAGQETTVTPDASTPLDDMLSEPALLGAFSEPSAFDKPGQGQGNPAPPEDDSRFFNPQDQEVRKGDLAENFDLFADDAANSQARASSNGGSGTDGSATAEGTTSQPLPFSGDKTPVKPASATSPKGTVAAPPASQGNSTSTETPLTFSFEEAAVAKSSTSSAAAATDIAQADRPSFPVDEGGATVASQAKQTTQSRAGSVSQERNSIQFFGNGQKLPASGNESNAAMSSASGATSFPDESSAAANSTVKTAGATLGAGAQITRTSATASSDELPNLFVPEPVPDVTNPGASETESNGRQPISEFNPFEEDGPSSTPVRPLPVQPVPVQEPNLPFPGKEPEFNEDPVIPERNPSPGTRQPETPLADEPFMEDEPATLPSPDRPARPIADEPSFPAPGSDSGSLTDEPFEMDRPDGRPDNGGTTRPLPAAEEIPGFEWPERSRPPGSADPVGRTTTEVMRPQLNIRKDAPKTASVGVAHDYMIVVVNEGETPAYDVLVEDELGGAAEFVESRPIAEFNRSSGKLEWNIAQLDAGETQEIRVRIRPTGEGTLDGIATVRFKAQVKAETVITSPKLELDLAGPAEVKVGDEVPLTFTIRNRGSGDANNVILRSVLPVSLKHPEGGDLEYEIQQLRAGESESVDLTVVAAEPGDLILVSAEVTTSGITAAKARAEIGIVGAQLSLKRNGPERRFVGRSATFQNIVTNESRFEALNATVVEAVPDGMRFVSASNGGEFDPDTRRIQWNIPRLIPGKQAVLEVELLAEAPGQMETMVEVTEDAGFRTPLTENTIVTVEDLHNVTADISHQDGPVAIGERFGFTITIDNRGTAMAKNMEMAIIVPKEIRVLAAGTRQVPGRLVGNTVKFNVVPEIKPNASMTFQVTLQGESPVRNALVQAQLKYDEMPEPLIVTESVTVFDDRP